MKSITLTAIDVGTHSIMGLTARKDLTSNQIEVLARTQFPCIGVRHGEVVRPEQVAVIINNVKLALQEQAGVKIKEVLVNIGGSHLFSIASQGLVSVSRADQKISKEDVERVIKAARAINIHPNKEILDVMPREFIIDGEGGIKEPLGLQGIRLEVKTLLVCLFTPVLENLGKSFAETGISMSNVLPSPVAGARAVLSQEQKELGVVLLDIGAGTTCLSVFEQGDLVDFAVFPIGSSNITNDIAIGLRTEISTAEEIKKTFANLKQSGRKGAKDKIEIPDKNLVFPRKFLKNIVEARVSEIFTEACKHLKRISVPEQLPAGIVLTGGGANLPGIVEFAKQRFKLPCRLGTVKEMQIDESQYSICCGLLLLGFENGWSHTSGHNGPKPSSRIKRIFRAFLP